MELPLGLPWILFKDSLGVKEKHMSWIFLKIQYGESTSSVMEKEPLPAVDIYIPILSALYNNNKLVVPRLVGPEWQQFVASGNTVNQSINQSKECGWCVCRIPLLSNSSGSVSLLYVTIMTVLSQKRTNDNLLSVIFCAFIKKR